MSYTEKFDNEGFYAWLENEGEILLGNLKSEFGMEKLVARLPPCLELPRERLYETVQKIACFFPHPLNLEIPYIADKYFDIASRIFPCFDTMLVYHLYAESLLYFEPDYAKYKEHFVHPFKVAYVADKILSNPNVNGYKKAYQSLLRQSRTKESGLRRFCIARNIIPGEIITEDFVSTAMLFTSLFHDIGYMHFMFCQAEEKLKRAYPFYGGDAVAASLSTANRQILRNSLLNFSFPKDTPSEKNENSDMYLKFPDYKKTPLETAMFENMNTNHSMSGALTVLSYLKALHETSTSEMFPAHTLMFNLAAEAIFTHDLMLEDANTKKQVYNGPKIDLKFSENPLGVILILADNLQSWGRPKFESTESSEKVRAGPNLKISYTMNEDTSVVFQPGQIGLPSKIIEDIRGKNYSKRGDVSNKFSVDLDDLQKYFVKLS